jgi:peptide/nickel transport system permease protein
MAFLRFAAIRVLIGAGLIFASIAAVFFFMRLLGNPIAIALGCRFTDEEIAARTEQAGFNRPLIEQFLDYLAQLGSGSFGTSIIRGDSIVGSIAASLPATIELGIAILLIAILVGLPLGTWLALRARTKLDNTFRTGTIVLYALPSFVFAVILKLVFSVWIPLFPASGRMQVQSSILLQTQSQTGFAVLDALRLGNMQVLADVLWHLTLPALSVGLIIGASFTRAVRAAVLNVVDADWYLEARNRFGGGLRTRIRHLLLPAAAPIVNAYGLHDVSVFSGLIFIEEVFEVRGIGFLLTDSILARDYTVVQGITIVVAIIVVTINLISDLISAAIDPRYRIVIR